MLKELMRGREKSQIVIIEDDCDNPGNFLLHSWIINLIQRYQEVHVLLYETNGKKFQEGLEKLTPTSSLRIHDFTADPLGWEGGELSLSTDPVHLLTPGGGGGIRGGGGRTTAGGGREDSTPGGGTTLAAGSGTPGRGSGTPGGRGGTIHGEPGRDAAVVIDSLSGLIFHRSPSYTCQILHKLTREDQGNFDQVVAVYHQDLHTSSASKLLRHTASSVIHLGPPASPAFHASGRILHKKSTGKIIKVREQFVMTGDYEISETEEIHKLSDAIIPSAENTDPAANLTFNLTLSDKEKEDRSKVPLPYLHKPEQEAAGNSGKIFYQPDDADDFDEEDPDDDLDI